MYDQLILLPHKGLMFRRNISMKTIFKTQSLNSYCLQKDINDKLNFGS